MYIYKDESKKKLSLFNKSIMKKLLVLLQILLVAALITAEVDENLRMIRISKPDECFKLPKNDTSGSGTGVNQRWLFGLFEICFNVCLW